MASSQGLSTAAYRAGDVARRLEHGWIGPEHVLLALYDEPSTATQALEELGVTREQVEEATRARGRSDPPPLPYDPEKDLSPNPAWYKLTGCAKDWPWPQGTIGPSRSTSCSRWSTPSTPSPRPGSEWRWGFNWLPDEPAEGAPRRARVDGEEGVDLDAALAAARERIGS